MSYFPNEQHAVGDAEAGVKGPVVLGRDQATGLVAPLMGSEGDDNTERAPLTGAAGKSGAIGWLTLIWQVLNDVVSSVVSVSAGQAGQTSAIVTAIQQPQSVVPPHVGTNGDPFSVAVEEGYDPDNPIMYPLVLKAGTSQKQLMTSVEHSALPTGAATDATVGGLLTNAQLRATAVPVSGPATDAQMRASAIPVSLSSIPVGTGVALDATVAAVTTSLGTDGYSSVDTRHWRTRLASLYL